ncbi:hypothetical protein C0992_007608, partial [Termitomyces sp. T32_za158]
DDSSGHGLSICAALFMHPGLQNLKIKSQSLPILSFMIPSPRIQNLTFLAIQKWDDLENLQDSITVFADLPKLQKLILPFYAAQAGVLEVASTFPALQSLQSHSFGWPSICDPQDHPPVVVPKFIKGCFPTLKAITVAGCQRAVEAILNHPFFPNSVNSISIDLIPCSFNCFTQLHKSVATICPDITSYCLYTNKPEEKRLSFEGLQPLFSCNLKYLDIVVFEPLSFSPAELLELASSFPEIEEMHLNEHNPKGSGITLDMLLTISRCCPKLRILGVALDTTKPSNEDMLHIVPFNNNLEKLEVGWSPLSSKDAGEVAMFLAQVLPSHCKFLFKRSNKKTWDILMSILPALRMMKDLGRRSANKWVTIPFGHC